MHLTEYFGIKDPVPFYDADSHDDTRVFVDPSRIRWAEDRNRFREEAATSLGSFSQLLVKAVRSGDTPLARRVRGILSAMNEPKETHLGMSAQGVCGHGASQILGNRICEALAEDGGILNELEGLNRLEHLALFVRGIDNDVMSDMTTRVIMGALAHYTIHMMEEFPELRSKGTVNAEVQVWDSNNLGWSEETFVLPAIEGEPIILVPAEWVGTKILMNHRRYFETTVVGRIQDLTASILPSGSVKKIPKADLIRRQEYRPARSVSPTLTRQAAEQGIYLIDRFERWAKRAYLSGSTSAYSRGTRAA